jgi:hypothetical protein
MFELDRAIAEWRRQMSAGGVESSTTLDELESHLREDIEQQARSGMGLQQAFEIASKQIGSATRLKAEFRNAGVPLETWFVNLAGIACGTIAFLFSGWILCFLFHREIDFGWKVLGASAAAAAVLSWRYSYKVLPVVRRQGIRTLIGFISCVAAVVWMLVFVKMAIPGVMMYSPGKDLPVGRLFAVFLWGWSAMAVLGGVGHGLEKAAMARNARKAA